MATTSSEPVPATAATPRRRWVRILGWTAAVLALLLVVFHAAGGWYFSNQIRAQMDVSGTAAVTYPATVVSSANGQVGVKGSTVPADEKTALMWAGGGVVRLGAGTEQDGVQVRPLSPGPVDDPPVLPAVGTAVRTEGFFYVTDPRTDLGLDFSEVAIACPLGTCPAWYVPGTRDTWVILTHGLGVDRPETLRMLQIVHAAGYPALAVTYRNDDAAPATDGLVRFGQKEAPDLSAAIDYALAQGASDVILAGFSTGGAISMATVMQSDQAHAVRAVILDAPMLDFRHTVQLAAADRSLPVVGLPIPPTLVATSTWLAGTRFGLDYGAIDYVARAGELTVPVLILMGTDDTKVYPQPARELAAARPDLVRLVEFPGAGHVRSWNIDTTRYTDTVNDFLASTQR